MTFAQYFVETSSDTVDDRGDLCLCFILFPSLLRYQRPQLVKVHGGTEVLLFGQMVMAHTDLTEVTWMVFIPVNSVVVLASSVSTTTRMLPVLTDTAMTMAHVAT